MFRIDLIEELMEKNWCDEYLALLNNADEHDTREKILNSIVTLADECHESLRNNRNLITNLKKLKKEYIKIQQIDYEVYFNDLVEKIDFILARLDTKDEF